MDQQVSSPNQQAINVKEHLAKLDKYDNEKLSLVIAIAAVLSAALFLAPVFEIRAGQVASISFSFAELSSIFSILKMSSSLLGDGSNAISNYLKAGTVDASILNVTLFISLVTMVVSLSPKFKNFISFLWVPGLANLLVLFLTKSSITNGITQAMGGSNSFGIGCELSLAGYIYVAVHLAIICASALIFYRNNEAKKAAFAAAVVSQQQNTTVINAAPAQTPAAQNNSAVPATDVEENAAPAVNPAANQPAADNNNAPSACPNCGAELPENAKFCGKCGTALK
ncbi:zinc ribbon domain-containing protein [uncultured Streptococcus sp.]|uniref:zinc ribbon domain-containing protein n=1 Tax=uncultured Streptococcus sp. TaxID=83427 RepID=UPI003211C281